MRDSSRRLFRPQVSVIKRLIVLNVAVFIFTLLGGTEAIEFLGLSSGGLARFQIWRLVTYMFVHGGIWHLFFNMWGLYLFGTPVEQRLGPKRFLRLYLLSGVVGAGLWLLANWSHSRYLLIGASGGVFGVMMAAAMSFPNMQILLLFPPIPMKLRTMVLVYAVIEASMAWRGGNSMGSNIAHLAHLGGLLGAFFYMKHLGFQSPYRWFRNTWLKQKSAWNRRNLRVVPPAPDDPYVTGLPRDIESETDRILDKIGTHGIQSLTPEERRVLEVARERLRQRGGR
jgi:membrane associated rhomboid family serine protease